MSKYTTPRFEARFRNGTWIVFDFSTYSAATAHITEKAAVAEAAKRNAGKARP